MSASAQSSRQTTEQLTLQDELIASFQNPYNLQDDSLFIKVPTDLAQHNNLPVLLSLLYLPSDLPISSDGELNNPGLHTPPISPAPTPSITQTSDSLINLTDLSTPISLSPITMSNSSTPMPARGEHAAPTFDKTKPRELLQFFDDLEYLMERAAITSESDKKKQAVRYTDFDTEQVWKTFPEFKNNTVSYQDFKQAILVHYPDASGDFIYSLRDMDSLISERQHIGINSTQDLSDYHLQFMSITTWLKEKKHLGELEQQRAYIRAFQPPLLSAIQNCLQLKNPNHHPSIPHTVEKVYEVARFVLQGTNQSYLPATVQMATQPTNPPVTHAHESTIKREELNSIFAEFTKNIVEVLNQNNRGHTNNNATTCQTSCNFCGKEHYIKDCELVTEYIQAGKCKRNQDNKVVLPLGAFIPHEIPGTLLREWVDKWHRRNPNQLAAATMLHMIDMRIIKGEPNDEVHPTFTLSTNDQIATLEAELYSLRARKPNQASNI